MKKRDAAVLILCMMLAFSASSLIILNGALALTPIYFTAELHPLGQLTDLNSSLYGLEIPATAQAVGDNFTVELHIHNATTTNLPFGLNGIEVHLDFSDALNYCVPIAFSDSLGETGGALEPPLLESLSPGFYAANGTLITGPPYNQASYYEVAAATIGDSWNGEDGIIANITFQITRQPGGNDPPVSLPIVYSYGEADTMSQINPPWNNQTVATEEYPDCISGELTFDTNYKPPSGNYLLSIQENPLSSGIVDVNVGGVEQTAPYLLQSGTIAQLKATPNTGYSFLNWTMDGAYVSSANPYNITMDGNHTVIANFYYVAPPPNLLPVTLTAEPVPLSPLTCTNVSLYDLEIPATQVSVGQSIVIELHLRNATESNVPLGVGSIEAHFYFGNLTDYLQPVKFDNLLGASQGILNPAVQFTIPPGYYDAQGNDTVSPYEGAVSYDVAATSTGTGWESADGLVANLTFVITRQPEAARGENSVSFPLDFTLGKLNDTAGNSISHDCVNATITLDSVVHYIALTNVSLSKTVVGEGYSISINVTAANQGSVPEQDLSLTVYANTSVMDTQTISLPSDGIMTVTFTRNTTGFAKGHYTITAAAEGTFDETNTTNNTFDAGYVTVTVPGDIDGNGKVNLADLVHLALAYGSRPGQARWNPNADINCDGIIDVLDLNILAQYYGL